MKIQQKINIRFLVVTLVLFALAGIIFYLILGKVIDKNVNDTLESRRDYAKLYLREHNPIDSMLVSPDGSISVMPILLARKFKRYSDTVIYDEDEKELVKSRKLTFVTSVDGKYYKVTIVQSLVESEDLMTAIFYFMVALFISIFVALFFVNKWLSGSTWKPFFKSLAVLQSFKTGDSKPVNFNRTGIFEFDELNRILQLMMEKIQTDFKNLKEFSENASHEIQTPLAIIKSKLEMVLQDKNLAADHHQRIHAAYESANRLSKLNEALLLLSKIENQQFIEREEIDLCGLIRSRIAYLEELIAFKQIELTINLDAPVIVQLNPLLAEILMNNLLGNALKHNIQKGKIIIRSENRKISIVNTGKPLVSDPSKLFRRFAKQNVSGESTGLGLAIAYEICKSFNLGLTYHYSEPYHTLTLNC